MVSAAERRRLARTAGVYGVVGGALGTGAAFGAATLAGVPPLAVAFLLAVTGVTVACLAVGVGDEGIETVSDGAEVGFSGGNPTQYQPDGVPGLDRLAVVCFFAGLGLYGVGALAVLS